MGVDEATCASDMQSESGSPMKEGEIKPADLEYKSFEGPEKMKLLDRNYCRFFAVGESNTVYTWETKVVMEQDEFDQVVTVHKMEGFEIIPVSKSL